MASPGLALVLAIAAATGCTSKRQPPRPTPVQDTAANQAVLKKLAAYADCVTAYAPAVFRIADVYRAHFADHPPAADPAPSAPFVEATASPVKCTYALGESHKLKPPMPELEALGQTYSQAIEAVFTLTGRVHGESDPANKGKPGQTYDPAHAASLHGELLAAFTAFDRAEAAVFDQVVARNRTSHLAQLEAKEARDGRTLPNMVERAMLDAEDLVRFAAVQSDQLDRLDLAGISDRLATYGRALDDIEARVAASPSEAGKVNRLKDLIGDARELEIAGKQLAQRARDKIAFSDSEQIMIRADNAAAVVGAPAAVTRAYNRLIDAYNQQ